MHLWPNYKLLSSLRFEVEGVWGFAVSRVSQVSHFHFSAKADGVPMGVVNPARVSHVSRVSRKKIMSEIFSEFPGLFIESRKSWDPSIFHETDETYETSNKVLYSIASSGLLGCLTNVSRFLVYETPGCQYGAVELPIR
jgi:hypothetical protein